MEYSENTLVDFLNGHEMCFGVVLKVQDGGVRVTTTGQDNLRVANRQVWVNWGRDGREALVRLAEAKRQTETAMAEVDAAFLWEIFSDKPGDYPLAELSEAFFGDRTPIHLSALARSLPEDTVHFQRQPSSILVRSTAEAAEVERLRRLRAEKAALRERTEAWLAKALLHNAEEAFPVPEEQEQFLKSTIDYLMCGTNSDAVNLLARIRPKMTAREAGIRLLKATHRMPPEADEFLLVNGIHAGFSRSVLAAVEALPDHFPTEGRKLVTEPLVFSIDDLETREIDDALSCRRDGENYVVGVYIADPACYVFKDDVLDEAASERPLSLYLPTTTVMMFPDRLSTDLASLNQGVQRPCLAFRIVLNDSGEVLDWNLAPSLVTVSHRLDYDGVDKMLANPGHSDLDIALSDLLKLADTMREFREEDGAVVLNRPELRVRVRDGEVSVAFEDQESPAHRLVAEFMVLANHLAAKYALLNEIPVIYRVQDPPAGEVCSVHKYEPYFFDQQVRRMKRTRLSTYPQPHFGLGLDLYIQISSPLRRYADLVLHRQLAAHCLGKKPPYTQEELFSVLDNVDSTANANRAYEREADHHWLLEYLRRNCLGQEMGATVMRVEGSLVLAELDYYCIRGVVLCRDKPSPGEHVRVTVKEVYPDAQRLVLSLKD